MEMKNLRPWLPTYTGKTVDILEPNPEIIDVHDIAHALSMTCRFGGHCRDFYSVAEHSVLVYSIANYLASCNPDSYPDGLTWNCLLATLLHDAAEAYVGDLISPIKRTMTNFVELENKWLAAIDARFQLGGYLHSPHLSLRSLVKKTDEFALAIEIVNLYPNPNPGWWVRFPAPSPHDVAMFPVDSLPPAAARQLFLRTFFWLEGKRGNKSPWSQPVPKP